MSAYIDGISQAATAQASGTSAENNTNDIMGKQDFLSLLVAQLQNQDPLNPDDPTEFTAQLAQFSSLEQLFNLNESMDNLVQSNANSDRLSTLNTIGKEVVYEGSSFKYNGEPVSLGYKLDGEATQVKLSLQHNGVTVATLDGSELGEGLHYLEWDGKTAKGQDAPIGDYKIVVNAKATEGESVGATSLVRAEVTGVDLGGEYGGTLITNFGEVAFNNILGVYDPESKNSQNDANDNEDVNDEPETSDIISDATENIVDETTENVSAEVTESIS
ncbi:flagellar hook assembly protein FlgD [Desulfopila sp. IMCC35008]|uniref:flagellar hook assembly protein FlgD n=1 Tax=Desulfopila sp. IMCC35008 TaxID=2653858 RepID=UPI0013D4F326|nr:flagellar hook assembly protein FlgD [Desulfopila sp. IMCC35008]